MSLFKYVLTRLTLRIKRSFKVKSSYGTEFSISHFYRDCELWPRLDSFLVLSSSSRPRSAKMSKRLFMGGKGKIDFTAQLHRSTWIAGQRCYIDFKVSNDTRKAFKSLSVTLIRTTTLFKPHPFLDALPGRADPDACRTTTTSKPVATDTLVMARVGEKGRASAEGWWTGVNAKDEIVFSHYIPLPVGGPAFPHTSQIFSYLRR